jgi:hypothetical protein
MIEALASIGVQLLAARLTVAVSVPSLWWEAFQRLLAGLPKPVLMGNKTVNARLFVY